MSWVLTPLAYIAINLILNAGYVRLMLLNDHCFELTVTIPRNTKIPRVQFPCVLSFPFE